MSEKFDSKFENPPEDRAISKEDLLTLRENQEFLGFVERFKSLQKDAAQKGIDISGAINYLETGEGAPDLVEQALRRLGQEDIEGFKRAAERSGRSLSEEEIAEIEQKIPSGAILKDFNFFMNLPGMKKKIGAESGGRPAKGSPENITLKQILREGRERSEEWEQKVLKARGEFQKSTWDELREYARLVHGEEKSAPEIRETIDYYIDLLRKRAAEVADRNGVGRYEIFDEEKDPELYIDRDYVKGEDFKPPSLS